MTAYQGTTGSLIQRRKKMARAESRTEMRRKRCPKCEAASGEPCRHGRHGSRMRAIHAERKAARP